MTRIHCRAVLILKAVIGRAEQLDHRVDHYVVNGTHVGKGIGTERSYDGALCATRLLRLFTNAMMASTTSRRDPVGVHELLDGAAQSYPAHVQFAAKLGFARHLCFPTSGRDSAAEDFHGLVA